MPHNESLADPQVVKDIENNFTNGKAPGLETHVQLPTKYVAAGLALLVGVVIGRKFNVAALKTAKATENLAKSVSEVVE